MSKEDLKAKIETLEILEDVLQFRHPEGSFIMFGYADEKKILRSAFYYTKTGKPKDIVKHPPEYQNLTIAEMEEVSKPFSTCLFICIRVENKEPNNKPKTNK